MRADAAPMAAMAQPHVQLNRQDHVLPYSLTSSTREQDQYGLVVGPLVEDGCVCMALDLPHD